MVESRDELLGQRGANRTVVGGVGEDMVAEGAVGIEQDADELDAGGIGFGNRTLDRVEVAVLADYAVVAAKAGYGIDDGIVAVWVVVIAGGEANSGAEGHVAVVKATEQFGGGFK